MSTYQKYLTSSNSYYANVIEPDDGGAGENYFRFGNNSTGVAHWVLIKLPSDIPTNVVVSSATIRLAEYNTSYRGDNTLSVKISPAYDTWSSSTKYNTLPSYGSEIYDIYTTSGAIPSSSNYDYRTERYYRYYLYDRYDGTYMGSRDYSSYQGEDFYEAETHYVYQYSYYDTYVKYHTISIKTTIQKCINSGYRSILIYFDLPGTNDTRRYFKSQFNSNTNLQPILTINYVSSGCRAKYSGAWRNGIVNVKYSGAWKQGITYTKYNGVWRQGT